jgi:methionyl-tRNA formyltransferase
VFDTIILLTGPAEQSILASVLQGHNPQLTICPIETATELAALESKLLRCARLIAFTTAVVVPTKVLDQLGYGAYNFHPGSPQYPGWAPAHFAIYHQASEFGATAHIMTERVDAGPIVGVEMFQIPENISLGALEALAYTHLARLFWRLAKDLATQIEPFSELPIRWSGQKSSRRHYAAMCHIPLDISKEEFDRRIKAFGGNHFGITPMVTLHGFQFALMSKGSDPSLPKESENQLFRAILNGQQHAA